MIEAICNAIQLILTGACTVISLLFAFRSKARVWLLLALFSGVFFLGDLYWYLFLVFYQKTPQYSYVSDLSWDAAYLFLFLLLIQVRDVRIMPYRMMRQRKCGQFRHSLPVCAFFSCNGETISTTLRQQS